MAAGRRGSSEPWGLLTVCAVWVPCSHLKSRSGVTLGSLGVILSRVSKDSEPQGTVLAHKLKDAIVVSFCQLAQA